MCSPAPDVRSLSNVDLALVRVAGRVDVLAYDAARKACVALLAVQGLRTTSLGGHVAVGDAVTAQVGNVFAPFHRLRRERNRSEYPDALTPSVSEDDADSAIATAETLLETARRLLDTGQLDTV